MSQLTRGTPPSSIYTKWTAHTNLEIESRLLGTHLTTCQSKGGWRTCQGFTVEHPSSNFSEVLSFLLLQRFSFRTPAYIPQPTLEDTQLCPSPWPLTPSLNSYTFARKTKNPARRLVASLMPSACRCGAGKPATQALALDRNQPLTLACGRSL